jgi:gamma-glutamyltranspeptidase/glutathione hydrolase
VAFQRARPAVAAGHPATAQAAAEILRSGGSAADAAIAGVFAACVAETVFTGLGGGGFATHYEATTGAVSCLDFFVATPGVGADRPAAAMTSLELAFGGLPQQFSIGGASVAVPGVPAGCEALHGRFGRLPWADVLAPAMALAGTGSPIPPTHARMLVSLAGALTLGDGRTVYSPGGRLIDSGDTLLHPGLDRMLGRLATEGSDAFYRGEVARSMVDAVQAGGGVLTEADLERYAAVEVGVVSAPLAGARVFGRSDLNRCVTAFADLPRDLASRSPEDRSVAVAAVLGGPPGRGDTTNISVIDDEGNGCSVTTTMGLGSGVWIPGTGVHLNSMLGEGELVTGRREPGDRVASMMSPLVLADAEGLVGAAGAAGASRIRSALVQSVTRVLVEGWSPADAVAGPRFHPVGNTLHVEPGFPLSTVDRLGQAGWEVREWPALDHYFGGASVVTRVGAGADPRRDGHAIVL